MVTGESPEKLGPGNFGPIWGRNVQEIKERKGIESINHKSIKIDTCELSKLVHRVKEKDNVY